MSMNTIKFLADCRLQDHRLGTPQEEHYTLGQIVTVRDDVAQRWVRRGKAVEVEPPPPPPAVPKPRPEPVPARVTEEQVEETRAEMEKPAEEPPAWRRPPDRRKR